MQLLWAVAFKELVSIEAPGLRARDQLEVLEDKRLSAERTLVFLGTRTSFVRKAHNN